MVQPFNCGASESKSPALGPLCISSASIQQTYSMCPEHGAGLALRCECSGSHMGHCGSVCLWSGADNRLMPPGVRETVTTQKRSTVLGSKICKKSWVRPEAFSVLNLRNEVSCVFQLMWARLKDSTVQNTLHNQLRGWSYKRGWETTVGIFILLKGSQQQPIFFK